MTLKLYVTVPSGSYQDEDTFHVSVSNASMAIGTKNIGISITTDDTVTIKVVDPTKDRTSIAVQDNIDVYNSTIDFGIGNTYGTMMGSVNIKNGTAESASLHEKTFAASYNTTDTSAVITAITVPKGSWDYADMNITLTGKDASGATIDHTLNADELGSCMKYTNNPSSIILVGEDFGMTTITSVKADIGKLTANYAANAYYASWLYTHNAAAAWGYFTTDAAGIVVNNTFRIYNTDASLRNLDNGDLTASTTTTSTDVNRVAAIGNYGDIKIDGTTMKVDSTNVMVRTRNTPVNINGIVGTYGNPNASRDSFGEATTTLIVNPEIYLMLPDGISYDADGISFYLNSYNAADGKAGNEALSYQIDDISNLNTTGDGISIYRISFPEGTFIGSYGADGNQYKIEYTLPLTISNNVVTKPYYLNEMIQLGSANNIHAVPAGGSNSASSNTVVEDIYGINGGYNLAGISVGANTDAAQLSFTLESSENESEPTTYTVTYTANGGTGSYADTGLTYDSTYTVKSDAETGITREGYTFTGWNTDSNGNGTFYNPNDTFNVTSDTTLVAQWIENPEPVTYTVTYTANGGTGSYADTELASGSTYTVKSDDETGISREGYTFIGWNTDPEGNGTSYDPSATFTVTSDLALVAQWTENEPEPDPEPETYTVTYTANGGKGFYADSDLTCDSNYTVKSVSETGITREGYTFIGWNTDSDGKGTSYDPNDTFMITSDLALVAQWTKILDTYTVTYTANGGKGFYADTELIDDSSYTVKSIAETGITREGYTFVGWNTEPSGNGASYDPNDTFTVTSDLALVAQWSKDD